MTDARLEKCLKLEKERSFEKLNLNLFNKMFSSCEICGQVLDNIFTPVVVNISNSFTDFEKFLKKELLICMFLLLSVLIPTSPCFIQTSKLAFGATSRQAKLPVMNSGSPFGTRELAS